MERGLPDPVTPFPILKEPTRRVCRPVRQRKPYQKRLLADRAQAVRRAVQVSFLALNIWIGIQFYLFVRQYEVFDSRPQWPRPAGVEGWLPIAGLMNLKAALATGEIPLIHPAAMFLIVAFLLMSLLLRKAFCGWLCPVGTISELLWKTGRDTFGRNIVLSRWLDIPLRSLKYLLLGLFLWAIITMPAPAIQAFMRSPYGLIVDVQMLNFFRYLSATAAVVIGVLALLSVFIRNFWCRYLCPYGALMGLAALFSPLWIRRNKDKCIDCGKCAKACPSHLPVDTNVSMHSAECLGCLECVTVCPAEGALDLSLLGRRPAGRVRTEPLWLAGAVIRIFLGAVGYAKLTGHWDSPIPPSLYHQLIPNAAEYSHPR
ncbi:MAG: 4Fe-4S binding protein [Bryobacteraceae bacterium]|nr:4Fe-4S binding protein [Bryobacteraceae bacterium]